MPTLLLRLAGPLQSWGIESKFEIRKTESLPTKSGVIGMIASALGRNRTDSIDDLRNLKFGVRADQPGRIICDFHTAKKDEKTSYISYRYYISDGIFLAGVFSEDRNLLESIEYALKHPAFPLYLGRRSCPVTLPLTYGIVDLPLKKALEDFRWLGNSKKPNSLILHLEDSDRFTEMVKDNPVSYDPVLRKYGYRSNRELAMKKTEGFIEHDPFKGWEN